MLKCEAMVTKVVSLSPATYSGSCEEGDLNEEMVPILLHFIVNWYHTNTHSPHNPHNYPEKKYHYPPVTDEKMTEGLHNSPTVVHCGGGKGSQCSQLLKD